MRLNTQNSLTLLYRYKGQYVNDQKHGEGEFRWPDGRRYVGQWYNAKQHGVGTYTTVRGESGSFKNYFGVVVNYLTYLSHFGNKKILCMGLCTNSNLSYNTYNQVKF